MSTQKQSTPDRVYSEIKNNIIERRYLPGSHLVESEIMAAHNCSRATTREVLHRLVENGLAEHIPNKGVLVRRLQLKEIVDISLILQSLEVLAVRLAAHNRGKEELKTLEDALERCEKYIHQNDPVNAAVAVNDFKHYVAKISGNEYLYGLILQYYSMLYANFGFSSKLDWEPVHYERTSELLKEYRKILNAVERGDADEAARLVEAQMQQAIETAQKNF